MTPDTCADCVFSLDLELLLVCRRFPPTPNNPDPSKHSARGVWPRVDRVDWCGEHVLDPSKGPAAQGLRLAKKIPA